MPDTNNANTSEHIYRPLLPSEKEQNFKLVWLTNEVNALE